MNTGESVDTANKSEARNHLYAYKSNRYIVISTTKTGGRPKAGDTTKTRVCCSSTELFDGLVKSGCGKFLL